MPHSEQQQSAEQDTRIIYECAAKVRKYFNIPLLIEQSEDPLVFLLGDPLREAISEARQQDQKRLETARKALDWIAKEWRPCGTVSENAHIAYDCHCVAAEALSALTKSGEAP